MSFQVKNNVKWVGQSDPELKSFHGGELSTPRGSTYNSYLIEEEKTVLIDTVWSPYQDDFLKNLKKDVALDKIDYIVANHAESDHSGALPSLMKEIPNVPIYCSRAGLSSIKGHYHKDWDLRPVKTGDRIGLGTKELIFIEAPMLHWPDSMFTYLTGDNILFSNDAFGQHFSSEDFFNDKVDQETLMHEALKYYANILTPFSVMVRQKIKEFSLLGLPLDIIAPSHGMIWREKPTQIVEKYLEWANDYQEDQITIIYGTMWHGTERMAEKIAEGIQSKFKKTKVKTFSILENDKNELMVEIFRSKAVLVGSPTVNKGILSSVAAILEEIKGLGFKNKKAGVFGAYGWSGEANKQMEETLRMGGFEIVEDGIKAQWNPDEFALAKCREFGEKFAQTLQ